MTMRKTVLELDLAGYSSIARMIEENLTVEVVTTLNDQIQGFVDAGLAAISIAREHAVMATTGDGAILVFALAEEAHRFAHAVHEATRAHNEGKTTPSAQRWFRMGAATGDVHVVENEKKRAIAGTTIANAVRLETAAGVGQLLIEAATFEDLPEALKLEYQPEEPIKGKREEIFRARRCIMVPALIVGVAGDKKATIPQVLGLFDRLNPRGKQFGQLMQLIEMPDLFRPSQYLTDAERQDGILDWAAGRKQDGLNHLAESLRKLLENQATRP